MRPVLSRTLQCQDRSKLRCCTGESAQSMIAISALSRAMRAPIRSTEPFPNSADGRIRDRETVSEWEMSSLIASASRTASSSLAREPLPVCDAPLNSGCTTMARAVKGRALSEEFQVNFTPGLGQPRLLRLSQARTAVWVLMALPLKLHVCTQAACDRHGGVILKNYRTK